MKALVLRGPGEIALEVPLAAAASIFAEPSGPARTVILPNAAEAR